jgi:PelA/Pel-15E family pectate lyase
MSPAGLLALILVTGAIQVPARSEKAMRSPSGSSLDTSLAFVFKRSSSDTLASLNAASQQTANSSVKTRIKWADALDQKPEWYGSEEAVSVADNLLLYQIETGGWPKNIDMARVLTEAEKAALVKQKQAAEESTIDNGATYTQLIFLARVYTAKKLERHREAFLKGVDYLLKAQYANGGWPQYYPLRPGYYTHITYNDNAMIGVMRLLRDIARRKPDYVFVDEARRLKAEKAVENGIECILKTQVVVGGKRTVWAAQHDERTLAPAPARKFEPVSLTSYESVGIVRFLMGIDHPDERVIEAIESAVAWFEKSKINGIRYIEKPDASKLHGFDRVVVKDTNAAPLWARFYEIETNRPIFIGRDSRVKYDVSEIEDERRNGYRWYVDEPAALLEKDYPRWQKKWRQKMAVAPPRG